MPDDDELTPGSPKSLGVLNEPPTLAAQLIALSLVGPKSPVNAVLSEELWHLVEPWYRDIEAAETRAQKRRAWREWRRRVKWLKGHAEQAIAAASAGAN